MRNESVAVLVKRSLRNLRLGTAGRTPIFSRSYCFDLGGTMTSQSKPNASFFGGYEATQPPSSQVQFLAEGRYVASRHPAAPRLY